MTGFWFALLFFPLIGAALRPRNWGEAYLLGIATTGATLFVAGLLRMPMTVTLIVLAVAAAIVVAVRRPLFTFTRYPLAPTILTLLPILALVIATLWIPLRDFDGRVFWVLKAKALAHDPALNGAFFEGSGTFSPRNHYPLLLPLDGAAIMRAAGDNDDRQIRWLYLFTFIALVVHLRDRLGQRFTPAIGAWCAALLCWIPQLVVEVDGGATSAYADIPMAGFVAGALFDLLDEAPPWRFGLWLAALTLTKSEGLFYGLVLLAICALVRRRRALIALIPFATAAIALTLWRRGIPHTDDEDFLRELPTLPQHLDRIGIIAKGMLRHFADMPHWGLFWIAVIAAVAIAIIKGQWRSVRVPVALIASMLAVFAGVYLVTNWVVIDLINSSMNRLLVQLVAPAMYLLASVMCSHEVDEPALDVN